MTQARQTTLAIEWQSKNITKQLEPHLLDLSFTDNLSGAADDLTFVLEDRDGKWSSSWKPTFGDTAKVSITTVDGWFSGVTSLSLGTYAHDKISLSGPPKKASFSCVSAPLASGLRRRKRTRPWSGQTLQGMASDIAKRASISLLFDGSDTAPYRRREQKDKSDLEFLEETAKEVGFAVKVEPARLLVFDESKYDNNNPIGVIDLQGGKVINWSFDDSNSERYGSCHIKFTDPRTGKQSQATFTDPNASSDAQTLEVLAAGGHGAVDSIAQATQRCKGLLRKANQFAAKGRLTVVGDVGLRAGVVFGLTNAYGFDGQYMITRAVHHAVGGYQVALDVRRCLVAGY